MIFLGKSQSPNTHTHLFQSLLFIGSREGASLVDLLQAEAADTAAVLDAEELHQLVVVGADALAHVRERLSELVRAVVRVVEVGPNVLEAERRHAGEAGLVRLGGHTRIAHHDGLFDGFLLLLKSELGHTGAVFELFHQITEHCVLLELWPGGEVGPTLRAVVALLPAGGKTVVTEVVSA